MYNRKIALCAICFAFAPSIFAGSVDYLSNQSADCIRTYSRNASFDADAVFYNPAAIVFSDRTFQLYTSSQTILKNYSSTLKMTGDEYESTVPTPILPDVFLSYRMEKLAFGFNFGVVAGGGSLEYEDGIPLMVLSAPSVANGVNAKLYQNNPALPQDTEASFSSGDFEGSSIYYSAGLNVSYAINDSVGISLGARYVLASKTFEGSAIYSLSGTGVSLANINSYKLECDCKTKAQGVGGILGICFRRDDFRAGFRFESPTYLNFETTVNGGKDFGGNFTDGEKNRADLPGVIALGAGYKWNDFDFTVSSTVYLLGLSNADDAYENYDDVGFEASASCEYSFLERASVSVGYQFTKVGGNEDTYSDFGYALDCHTLGFGGKYSFPKDIDAIVGVSHSWYLSSDGMSGMCEYKKDLWIMAVGLSFKR